MRRAHDTLPPAVARIREELERRDMTIKDLALELGYTNAKGGPTTYLYAVLSGALTLTRDQISRIAALLDLDPDDLYILAGSLDPDLEQRLKTDRAFLRAVRTLSQNGQPP